MQSPITSETKRIVLKIGSSLLTAEDGSLRREWLAALAQDVASLHKQGCEVAIVSSGAVAQGRDMLGFADGKLSLEQKQAAASAGQPRLMAAWSEMFGAHDIAMGQILITLEDTEDRRRYLNARETVQTLWDAGAIPVINENDAVATEEIRYGDNDRLAARVAAMLGADMLVLMSDIDGLYTANPAKDDSAQHMAQVDAITSEILAMAGDAGSAVGTGGMVTKIAAAQIATSAGCAMVICDGREDHALSALQQGAKHTIFHPTTSRVDARKAWIAGAVDRAGSVVVDEGAAAALQRGNSLLPAGALRVEGKFERGDVIDIIDASGNAIGCGITAYSVVDAAKICGKQSDAIEAIVGYEGRSVLMHRDDMVLL